MAVDTPATIAIIGAGPIGLEAALYGRFLGYDVIVFEQGEIAEHVARWGHVEMFTPFAMNRSTLGAAALDAQGDPLPPEESQLTGKQWREKYLIPLAQSDLLADSIHLHTRVVDVSRAEILKHELPGSDDRATSRFRLLVEGSDRAEKPGEASYEADVVIDCSGVVSRPKYLGPGGGPAIGEKQLSDQIDHLPPDVLAADSPRFADRTTLVLGRGYSAATTVVALARLAEKHPATRVVWAVRDDPSLPIRRMDEDALPLRDALAVAANQIAGSPPFCTLRPESTVQTIQRDDRGKFRVRFVDDEQSWEFDNVVANVGFAGDTTITDGLQVHRCYASDGPMKLAAALMNGSSDDCLEQVSPGPAALRNPEPNFYVLGSKSYGRNPNFLYATGLEQVRDIFTEIGDRATLDLYATMGASS